MRRPSNLRSGLLAALVGLTIAGAVGIGGGLMMQAAARQSLPTLTEATQTGVETVGRTVAEQLGRALGYGIPLDGLYDLDGYFGKITAGSPTIDGLALRDLSGKTVYATGADIEGTGFPVTVDGTPRATLVLSAAPPLLGPAIDRLRIALAANAILVGLIGGVLVFLLLTRHYAPSRSRLGALMHDAMNDRFPPLPPQRGSGSVAKAYHAYDRCLEALRVAARTLDDAVATVRAIDFDGSLTQKLEPIVNPVAGILSLSALDDAAKPAWRDRSAGAIWLAVIVAGTYAMTMPFVANFAVDRQWAYAPPAWWPALPAIVEVVAAMLAFVVVRGMSDIGRPIVAAVGLVVAGFATASVFWAHDYTLFLELRGAAGAGLGTAVAALASRQAIAERSPFTAILLLTVLVAGPVVGALLGEAVGRRMSFFVTGCMILVLVPVALIVRRANAGAPAPTPADPWRLMPLAAAGVAIGSTLLVWLPAGPGYENYLASGLMFAVAGLAAATVPIRSPFVAAALVAVGMIAGSYPGSPLAIGFAAMALLGAGLGGLVAAGRSHLDEAVAPLGIGIAVGAASIGLAGLLNLPPLAPAAGLAAVLALAGGAVAVRAAHEAG